MTPIDAFERHLPSALSDLAVPATPDYLTDILGRTAATRQRPAWASLERWLPVDIATTRVPATRMPWRQLGLLALLAVLIAATLAIYIGSRQPHLPAPFGVAGNGLVADSHDGDLYTVDPRTGSASLLLGGPAVDEWITFTSDGTRGLFFRQDSAATTDIGSLGSVVLPGGAPVLIPDLRISRWDWVEPAPDGHNVAIESAIGAPLRLVTLDGSSVRTFDQVKAADYGGLAFLAPQGRELAFVAPAPSSDRHQLMALDVDTAATRAIVPVRPQQDIWGNLSASPDGTQIAYGLVDPISGRVAVHLVAIDGTGDREIGPADVSFQAWPQWSPDGRHLLVERGSTDGSGRVHPVIIDTVGGSEVEIGVTISRNGAGKAWSPDGRYILAQRTGDDGGQFQQELWDTATGAVSQVAWPSTAVPAWQRVATH